MPHRNFLEAEKHSSRQFIQFATYPKSFNPFDFLNISSVNLHNGTLFANSLLINVFIRLT
ncbi:hypothetical protein ALTERO38_50530 [Alteromonas sp. 38]|nr:hypothetical protein ALTER154_80738 [Alteromonas sp. 154]VXB36493.1 hypothetical protein ALTERO38_50530 [Alteromonas sp. 38]